MTREIVIASRNKGKIAEILQILAESPIKLRSLVDFPDTPEVDETGSTFVENARLKARAVARHTKLWALADDSGLEVDALGGRPGIRSARYAGGDGANNEKVLKEMEAIPDAKRTARFRAAMVLAAPDGALLAETEGAVEGLIAREPRGTSGFGYDPLFLVPEFGQTMAELGLE
ncbi:MAG TPA: RdgB/HAM1 family non-canonical purine NTP pyrophosphatase, partial [Planctomycetota bacterium]|nr:RdgB/HAM1 family non-canonical purine NTP pyrophosphatase [Planctomycetota bacterium]